MRLSSLPIHIHPISIYNTYQVISTRYCVISYLIAAPNYAIEPNEITSHMLSTIYIWSGYGQR
jgi:hypothetical protein